MGRRVDRAELVDAIRPLVKGPGRSVVAIAGAPGSGKSTLAEGIPGEIDPGGSGTVAVLPMDGFHYDDTILEGRGRRPWKGAPDTFDVAGLAAMLARLRGTGKGEVAVPVFDRDLELSRGSARVIGPETSLVLVEGNYLLLGEVPWSDLARFFDLTVMIEVPEDELRRRLAERWQGYGLSAEETRFKLDEVDLPNGRTVAEKSAEADITFVQG